MSDNTSEPKDFFNVIGHWDWSEQVLKSSGWDVEIRECSSGPGDVKIGKGKWFMTFDSVFELRAFALGVRSEQLAEHGCTEFD